MRNFLARFFNGPDAPADNSAVVVSSIKELGVIVNGLQDVINKQQGEIDDLVAVGKNADGVLNEKDSIDKAMAVQKDSMEKQANTMQKFLDEQAIRDQIQALGVGSTGKVVSRERKEYEDAFNSWIRGSRGGDKPGSIEALEAAAIKADLSVDYDPGAGFFVPEERDSEVGRIATDLSSIRQDARVITISTASYNKLVSLGGAVALWVGEREARPKTDTPVLENIQIDAHNLYAFPFATQDLLDDSAVDIAAWLRDESDIEFAAAEGIAYATGDGVKRPRGYLTHSTYVLGGTQTKYEQVEYIPTGADGDFASSSPLAPFYDAIAALNDRYHANAKWRMNRTTFAAVQKLEDSDGRSLVQPDPTQPSRMMLMGFPIRIDSALPAIASDSLSIVFADWSAAYTIVDRMGLSVLRDNLTNKPFVGFYMTKRTGGGLIMPEAMKYMKFASS